MGSLDIGSALPNSTKCDTWRKAEASHTTTKIVQLKLEDIYGPLILLLTGLIIGTMIFFLELVKSCMVKCHSRRKGALGMTHGRGALGDGPLDESMKIGTTQ